MTSRKKKRKPRETFASKWWAKNSYMVGHKYDALDYLGMTALIEVDDVPAILKAYQSALRKYDRSQR